MKKLKLDKNKITELIMRKRIYLTYKKTIEFYEDELVYIHNGRVTPIDCLTLTYNEIEKPNNYIHTLVCDHFNFKPNDVICTSMDKEDATFTIRFAPKKELGIIVMSIRQAIINTAGSLRDENEEKYCNADDIGHYHRLGKSCYFFRWDDDFVD